MSEQAELPEAYVDCAVLLRNGSRRIARLNTDRNHWQLLSYGTNKHDYAASLEDVVAFNVIQFPEERP